MLPCPKTREHQSTCVDSWVHRVPENGHQPLGRGNSLWRAACPILWSNPIVLCYFTKIAPSVLPYPKTQEHQSTCVDSWVHRVPENGHQPLGRGNSLWRSACPILWSNPLLLRYFTEIVPSVLPCPKTQEHQCTCVDSWVHRVPENGHQPLGRGNSLWHSACPILWSNPIFQRYFTEIAPCVLPCPRTQEHQSTCVDSWVHRVPENGHQPLGRGNSLWRAACPILWSNPIVLRYFTKIAPSVLPCPKTQEHHSTCVDSSVHRVPENGHQPLGRGNSLWRSACPILWSNPLLLRYFTEIVSSVLPCPKTQEHQSTCVDSWVHRVPENGHQPLGRGNSLWHSACPILWSNPIFNAISRRLSPLCSLALRLGNTKVPVWTHESIGYPKMDISHWDAAIHYGVQLAQYCDQTLSCYAISRRLPPLCSLTLRLRNTKVPVWTHESIGYPKMDISHWDAAIHYGVQLAQYCDQTLCCYAISRRLSPLCCLALRPRNTNVPVWTHESIGYPKMDISHWDAAIHYGIQLAQYCDQTRSFNAISRRSPPVYSLALGLRNTKVPVWTHESIGYPKMDISHWDAAIHYGVQLAQYCDQTLSCYAISRRLPPLCSLALRLRNTIVPVWTHKSIGYSKMDISHWDAAIHYGVQLAQYCDQTLCCHAISRRLSPLCSLALRLRNTKVPVWTHESIGYPKMDISHWDAAIHYGIQLAQYCDQTRSFNAFSRRLSPLCSLALRLGNTKVPVWTHESIGYPKMDISHWDAAIHYGVQLAHYCDQNLSCYAISRRFPPLCSLALRLRNTKVPVWTHESIGYPKMDISHWDAAIHYGVQLAQYCDQTLCCYAISRRLSPLCSLALRPRNTKVPVWTQESIGYPKMDISHWDAAIHYGIQLAQYCDQTRFSALFHGDCPLCAPLP